MGGRVALISSHTRTIERWGMLTAPRCTMDFNAGVMLFSAHWHSSRSHSGSGDHTQKEGIILCSAHTLASLIAFSIHLADLVCPSAPLSRFLQTPKIKVQGVSHQKSPLHQKQPLERCHEVDLPWSDLTYLHLNRLYLLRPVTIPLPPSLPHNTFGNPQQICHHLHESTFMSGR